MRNSKAVETDVVGKRDRAQLKEANGGALSISKRNGSQDAQELVDNLNYNVVNDVPSDRHLAHADRLINRIAESLFSGKMQAPRLIKKAKADNNSVPTMANDAEETPAGSGRLL
jgi:hypothetical protein